MFFRLFEKIQNKITHFLTKLVSLVSDNNNCNMRNLEKLIFLGRYNHIIN